MNIQDDLRAGPFWIEGGEYEKVGDIVNVNQIVPDLVMAAAQEQERRSLETKQLPHVTPLAGFVVRAILNSIHIYALQFMHRPRLGRSQGYNVRPGLRGLPDSRHIA